MAKHIKTDYFINRFGKEIIWDKSYSCDGCVTEWLLPINEIWAN